MTSDPAKHNDLKNSPRLPKIQEIFKAIATNKPAQDVRRLAANLMVHLNASAKYCQALLQRN
jgi:hypothetical protein